MTRLSLRQQFIMLFALLIVPVLLVNVYGNRQAESILQRNVTDAYVELIKQNRQLLSRDLDTINRVSSSIMLHPAAQQMLREPEATVRRHLDKYQELDKLLSSSSLGVNGGQAVYYYFFVNDPDNLYSFAPQAPLATMDRAGVYFMTDEKTRPPWYETAVANKGKGELMLLEHFGTSGKRTVAYVRAINDVSDQNAGLIGVLVAAGVEKKLQESLPAVSMLEGDVYVTDWSNRILASTEMERLGETLELPPVAAWPVAPSGTMRVADAETMYVVDYSYGMRQKLVYRIPLRTLLSGQRGLLNVLTLSYIVYAVFILAVIAYLWRSLVNPLRRMARFATSYEPGRMVPDPPGRRRKDEVGVLLGALHEMAKRINALVQGKYELEIRQREAQLQLLYQQINPHLLYNTLESIYWKSVEEGRSRAADMIKDLSVLMKIGLSRGRELIPLREELEHAQAYVSLQQKRFGYAFRVEWDLDPATAEAPIPKITLQPLIENAILHGVRKMADEGRIVIRTSAEGGEVVVAVRDNGYRPVDYASIAQVLADPGSGSGYGIRNVQQRIRLHFGDDYGLRYAPAEDGDGGTCVTLRLPARADEAGAPAD
ncbi:sensor histidine kinase [Paenibacillus sp. IB182496]|uniref:Sensor histidine kinase n=1 Tax=Paenibacillus sabuli TaxID=2772509 RepID=A0A927BZZ0_9BACL|nr:histidine kinase [Paenibacillus sabuli]MBD2848599.1 sensor histidine kinase [Paenibacillus sabuli]